MWMDGMNDAIIVGGGPVGLMLALELSLAGADPLVLERFETVDPTIKAGSLNARAADALRRRGVAFAGDDPRATAPLGPRSPSLPGAPQPEPAPFTPPRFAGHVAGMTLRPDLVRWDELGRSSDSALVAQQQVQAVLRERLVERGVEVRQGVTVTGVTPHADHVVVHSDAGELEALWVVGADGGRSTVRKSAGFGFPGLDGVMTGYQALVAGDGLDDVPLGWHITPTGVFRRMPNNLILTAEFDGAPADRTAEITAAELTRAIRAVTGVDATVTAVLSATRFTDNTRAADHYRRGRVLLAGDAAHVHPPFGGQGLSLGMLDATALGWRLGGVIAGRLPERVLEDYEQERRPEAERILDWSRAQVAVMRTDERSRAAGRLVRRLIDTPDGATEMVRVLSGEVVGYGVPGELAGSFAADWAGAPGETGSYFDAAADGAFVLAHRPDAAAPASAARDGVRVFTTADAPASLALVRPDGVIAWAGDDAAGLADALTGFLPER
ncbi:MULTISPECIES: FAD-dependent monooxygenase [unclassified Microbacterium]|uniref:FAD-dependent monooxygenase n=1 Tax=unclassified Microbacterium TaxID=2609290 RepID=UPI00301AFE2C